MTAGAAGAAGVAGVVDGTVPLIASFAFGPTVPRALRVAARLAAAATF